MLRLGGLWLEQIASTDLVPYAAEKAREAAQSMLVPLAAYPLAAEKMARRSPAACGRWPIQPPLLSAVHKDISRGCLRAAVTDSHHNSEARQLNATVRLWPTPPVAVAGSYDRCAASEPFAVH